MSPCAMRAATGATAFAMRAGEPSGSGTRGAAAIIAIRSGVTSAMSHPPAPGERMAPDAGSTM